MIKNEKLSLIFKIILAIGCFIGIILETFIANRSSTAAMFCFYTVQSNILCLITIVWAIVRIIKKSGENKFFTILKSCSTMVITITFLIFSLLLSTKSPFLFAEPHDYANFLVHYFTPVMIILDWLLFDKKGSYKFYYPLIWLAYPLLYTTFVFIRAAIFPPIFASTSGNLYPYPYFFFDVDVLGVFGVTKWIVVLLIASLVVGYIYVAIDRLIYSLSNKRASNKI